MNTAMAKEILKEQGLSLEEDQQHLFGSNFEEFMSKTRKIYEKSKEMMNSTGKSLH